MYCFYPFLFSFKFGIDKSTEWSMIPVCPSLMRFFNRGNIEGINSFKKLCWMFVYVLFEVNLCQDSEFLVSENLWFDDLCAE